MIFPIINGILNFKKAPAMWGLFVINLVLLIFTSQSPLFSENRVKEKMNDDLFVKVQGQFFSQYIEYYSERYPPLMKELSRRTDRGDMEAASLLGGMALRDNDFLNDAKTFEFTGDKVAYKWWVRQLASVEDSKTLDSSYIFGLQANNIQWQKWFSYQFIHSGYGHFFGNMVFLLIFGSAVEPLIGSVLFLIIYLAAGVIGAALFLLLSGTTSIPLIGASGAVSGIMTLFSILFWSKPTRYVYFLFIPKPGYAGYVYLPGWVTFLIWFLTDSAGFLSGVPEMGGVAYAAHLGGDLAGGVSALALLFLWRKTTTQSIFSHHPGFQKL